MLPIFEIIMMAGGIYAIISAKVPWYFGGGLKYQAEGTVVRMFGALLILPQIVWLLVFIYDPFLLFMVDFLALLGMVTIVVGKAPLLGKEGKHVNDMGSRTSSGAVEASTKIPMLSQVLFLVMAITIYLGIWVRLTVAGWYLIMLGIPLLLLVTLHFVTQITAIRRITEKKPSYVPLILLSNLFFFLGFAFQVDIGDGPGSFLAIAGFYETYFKHGFESSIPDGQSYIYTSASIGFLIALIISWFLLLANSFRKQESSA